MSWQTVLAEGIAQTRSASTALMRRSRTGGRAAGGSHHSTRDLPTLGGNTEDEGSSSDDFTSQAPLIAVAVRIYHDHIS